MYLHEDASLFGEALIGAAAEMSLSEEFVAKDYWAMMMLKEVTKRNSDLVFKGGTCLSKCYNAINRFSEDVDLGIPYEHATEGMRKAIKRAVVESADALGVEISNLSETRSRREYNRYDFRLHDIARTLILETAVMTPASPYELKTVQSFVGMFVEERDSSLAEELGLCAFETKANSLERTFVDKVFAICDYYMAESIPPRQSRHIYDLRKLLDMVELNDTMLALFETVRKQRAGRHGNFSAGQDINLAGILDEIVKNKSYRSDYEQVTQPLLYEELPYESAIVALSKIADFLKLDK